MPHRLILVALVVGSVAALHAQQPKPTLEVASVRRNLSGPYSSSQSVRHGGVFTATNQPLVRLIQSAFGLEDFQLDGGPDWGRNHRFDVNATAGSDVPREQLRLMMQALLEDRFKLVIRREQRDMPVYELTLARNDGRPGPQLVRVDDCSQAKPRGPEDSPVGATRTSETDGPGDQGPARYAPVSSVTVM